jgi:hypothetical protein
MRARQIVTIALAASLFALQGAILGEEIQKWQTPGGGLFFGEHPPPGSTLLGTTESMGTIGGGPVNEAPSSAPEASLDAAAVPLQPLGNPSDAPVATGVSLAKRTRLYFDTWSQRGLSASELEVIERNLNAVRNDVGRSLGVDPDVRFQVILTEPEVFHRYSGTRAHVSGLFDGKIHIPIPTRVNESELQGTLWHEYTHAVISLKAGGNCPVWLNEGIATYQQSKIDPQLRDGVGHLLGPDGKLPYTWAELDATLHSRTASPRAQAFAYLQAYAVADYLYERYRSQRVNALLDALRTTPDVEAALRETLQTTLERLDQQTLDHVKRG